MLEDENENELSLELSIGGSYEKILRKQVEDIDVSGGVNGVPRSGVSLPERAPIIGGDDQVQVDNIRESGSVGSGRSEVVVLDSQRKREIQALRRQEARKKREEKLIRKSGSCNTNNTASFMTNAELQLQSRARENEEEDSSARKRKCVGNHHNNNIAIDSNNFTFRNGSDDIDGDGGGGGGSATKLPAGALSFRSPKNVPPQFQKNGFAHPHNHRKEVKEEEEESILDIKGKNIMDMSKPVPVVINYYRSFRPYPVINGNLKLKLKNDGSNCIAGSAKAGCDAERNGGSQIPKLMSVNGSPERTSSAVSDYRSTSAGKGGRSSSESGSHSSSNINRANEQQFGVKMTVPQPQTIGNGHPKPKPEAHAARGCGGGGGDGDDKPKHCLPRMPCVSTTGNGPNGKTVTGFLYRYTKTEVSIVCVCHGSCFTPAEFVEHAGGTDITNPLRHITMVPSCFGANDLL